MKKVIFFLALALLACESATNKYTVEGVIKGGKKKAKYAILERRDPLFGFQAVDTAKVTNNTFMFEGKINEPGLFFVKIDNGPRATIILEKGKINLTYRADSIMSSLVSGTYNNEELMKFTRESMSFQKELLSFSTKNKDRIALAESTKDTAAFLAIRQELFALREKIDSQAIAYNEQYIAKHPKSFIAGLIVEDYTRRFADDPQRIETAFKKLDPSIQKTRVGKNIAAEIANMKTVDINEKAPNFMASTPDGKIASLYESLGQITIIDFWASWCKPCRIENPSMVKLVQEFGSKGLKVIGVSLDKDVTSWKKAILDDQLTWTQVSHLKEWNCPIAKQYGVESIPATFILNQYGVVVAKNLTGESLRKKVAALLEDKKDLKKK